MKPANVEQLHLFLESYPTNLLLGGLHSGLMDVFNDLQNITRLIYRDFTQWFHHEKLPRPNVFWQRQLLNADDSSEPLLKLSMDWEDTSPMDDGAPPATVTDEAK